MRQRPALTGPDLGPWTPRKIVAELDQHIVGQADAKRSVAIALRNRYRRQLAPDEIRDVVDALRELFLRVRAEAEARAKAEEEERQRAEEKEAPDEGSDLPEGLTHVVCLDRDEAQIAACEATNPPTTAQSDNLAYVIYTSGSTGKPKGVLHTTGGYMIYAEYTFKNVFQYSDGDIYWCTADVGWVTGHSYIVYGPLANG